MTTHDLFSDIDLSQARLVRHKLRHPRRTLLYPDAFAAYQEIQPARKFGDAATLLSFVNGDGTTAQFVGAWRVEGSEPGDEMDAAVVERISEAHRQLGEPLTRAHVRDVWLSDRMAHYRLARIERYDEHVGSLVVDWGPGARAWVQRADRQPKQLLRGITL